MARAEPDAIIHEMTALSGTPDFRHFDRWFALTNRLRTEGTRASPRRGQGERRQAVRRPELHRLEQQPRTGSWIKTEDDPLDPNPVKEQTETLAAIKFLERAVLDAPLEGIVVRYGGLYGPGSSETLGAILRKRMFPVIGNGAGIVSSTHVDDAAGGTVAALERGRRGIYNIVDDDPAPSREFIPAIAEALGAPKPLRIPAWLGRLLAGDVAVTMMTEGRGSSNAKAKRELGWQPIWPSWRDGFRHGLDSPVPLPPRATDQPTEGDDRRVTPANARDDVAEAYVDLRPLLFSIAYRMLVERQRGRGHRPGGVRPLPAGARRWHRRRVAEGLPVGRRHPPRDRPPQVGPRPARDVRRRVAAGAARDRRRAPATRPSTPSRPTRCRCRSSSCSSG